MGEYEARRAFRQLSAARPPVPGKQLVDAVDRVIGDAGEYVARNGVSQLSSVSTPAARVGRAPSITVGGYGGNESRYEPTDGASPVLPRSFFAKHAKQF
jgi:hypothetical protein